MRRTYTLAILLAAGSAMACWMSGATPAADAKEPMIGHMVYFQLTDTSPTAIGKMTAACDKYLKDHPGTAFYAAGTLAGEKSMFNDRDWDVALHLVFKSKADLDKYSASERHKQFVDENRSSWKKVRVFDSRIEGK
jgi:hypothetical protein